MSPMTRYFEQSVGPAPLGWVPAALTASRLALAPVMVVNAYAWGSETLFVVALCWAFVSDIYDGVIARWLKVDTPLVRRFDSATDMVFYLSTLWAVGVAHTDVFMQYVWPLMGLVALEVACNTVSCWRFGRLPATHTYTAKCWGISLFAALVLLLGFGVTGWVFTLMLALGYVAGVEVLAILLLSKRPPVDVAGLWLIQRLRLNQEMQR